MDREAVLAQKMIDAVQRYVERAVTPLRSRLHEIEANSRAFSALIGRPRMSAPENGDLLQRLEALEQRVRALEARE